MRIRVLLSLIFCFCFILSGLAQGIRGRITNAQKEPIPFANIYIPQLSTGTTSNIDGRFEMKLPSGNVKVLFQYLGYQTQSREFTIGKTFEEVNIQLETQDYQLPEVKVLASGEDPAYYIMRRAIAMAPYYQKQVSKYSCKVYLKGTGVFDKIPKLFKKQMKKDGVNENEAFVIETVSKIDFEQPDKLNQKVLAMRSSGKDNNTSPMGMITNNLYDADKYGIVSPVGKSALKTYTFSLEGVFEDQGRTINKIKVTPKSNSKDVFSGFIYIADGFWNIHSADLNMQMPMTDVNVHQVYGEVNRNTWMPVSLDFDMNFSGLGFKMKFRYVASINEYQTTLNPALDHSFLDRIKEKQFQDQQVIDNNRNETLKAQQAAEKTKAQKKIDELMKKESLNNHETVKLNRMIEAEARRNAPPEPLEIKSSVQVSQKQVNNDTAYWASLRPIPLTAAEKVSFVKKDSIIKVSSRPEYKDSVRNDRRKFKVKHLIFGKTYNYSVDSIRHYERLSIPTLFAPTTFTFNSVDGLRAELPFNYYRSDSLGRSFSLSPQMSYAFLRKKMDATIAFRQYQGGRHNAVFGAGFGTTTVDYNRQSGISAMNNDLYTLWLEENDKRLYRRDFVQIMAGRDLMNGLNLNLSLDYSDNSPLKNHSSYSFIDYKDKEIMPNIPENSAMQSWQLESHQSFIARAVLEYTPQYRYMIRNHSKMYVNSKFPTFSLAYKGAYSGIMGSDSRFDLLKLGIRQNLKIGIDDHLNYVVNAGHFLNSSKVYFEDFQHFNMQSKTFLFSPEGNSFRLLPFYEYATPKSFLEIHTGFQSRKLVLKQLPLLRNTSVSENLFVNYLSTPMLKNYVETGYGVRNILLLFHVEAFAGFENGKYRSSGIRVSMNLN